MNTPEIDEIDLAIDVLAALARGLQAQYGRREARNLNHEGYDAIKTIHHFELRGNLRSIARMRRELRQWKRRLQRNAAREIHQKVTL